MATQILFVLISPKLYINPSRHIALLMSFVANNFLVAIFISLSYKMYAMAIVCTTFITICYTVTQLNYACSDIAPIFVIISITCVVTAY